MSLQGIDRKAMEEERLARLALKQKAAEEEAPVSMAAKRKRLEDPEEKSTSFDSAKKRKTDLEPPVTGQNQTKQSTHSNVMPALATSSPVSAPTLCPLVFPRGAIKKTWVFGQTRRNDIKLEEVLQKDTLHTAVLSSFIWDMEWLFSKIDNKTKTILVMQAKGAALVEYRCGAASWSKSLRLCFPPMPGQVSCMHAKFMLLFHPTHLRIVVPTANLVNFDWGETGVMENSLWLIDLPRLSKDVGVTIGADATANPFAKELLRFLTAMELDADVIAGVQNFDFSATSNLAFVHTIGGIHANPSAAVTTGYPCLAQAVRNLGLASVPGAPLEVDFATSSVGSLRVDQIMAMYTALRGEEIALPGPSLRKLRTKAAPRPPTASTSTATAGPTTAQALSSFRVLFPTTASIAVSRGGPRSAGTICCQREYWEHPDFPRQILRNSISSRPGILSHNKLILARSPNRAFVYVGSANMSKSAWGAMTWNAKEKEVKMTGRNWECGVVVPVERMADLRDAATSTEVLPYSVFEGTLDVPFEVSAPRYGEADMPWFFSRSS